MLSKINDIHFWNGLKNEENQTIKMFRKFKDLFNDNEKNSVKLLEKVVLITPKNIHLNSFMYEPILDMSDNHLILLFKKVSILSK